RNPRRLIRALEVCLKTGPVSQQRQRKSPDYPILILGLTLPRHELYQLIDQRIEEMMARGWLEEVKGLLERGYSIELPALSSLGYHELGLVLKGQLDLAQAIQDIKYRSHNLARHQYAWFRPQDEHIHWLEANKEEDAAAKALKLAQSFLEREEVYALR
ncbi:MAG: tRNA dimethylallyltransferase, partial [Chloroflexota bacterium]